MSFNCWKKVPFKLWTTVWLLQRSSFENFWRVFFFLLCGPGDRRPPSDHRILLESREDKVKDDEGCSSGSAAWISWRIYVERERAGQDKFEATLHEISGSIRCKGTLHLQNGSFRSHHIWEESWPSNTIIIKRQTFYFTHGFNTKKRDTKLFVTFISYEML